MAEPSVPDDYAAFVAAHADRIRAATSALTGNERLVDRLQNDLFAAVALRWRWLHRRWPRPARPEAARDYLWGLLRREADGWSGLERRPQMFEPAPIAAATAADPTYRRRSALLAANTWAQAGQQRRRRRLIAGAVVLALGCGAVLMPGRGKAPDHGPRTLATTGPGLVSAAPPNVAILPRVAVLPDGIDSDTALAGLLDGVLAGARPFSDPPLDRAVMLAQLADGRLLLIAETGHTRIVDGKTLGDARAVETSLSPDGTLAAVPALDGVLLIDVAHATTRKVTSAVPRPPAFRPTVIWRGARTLIVTEAGGTSQVDVVTGKAFPLVGVTGLHTVVQQGGRDRLVDLLAVGADPGEPAIVRTWEGVPPTAAPRGDASDHTITGAPWLGGWLGAGWANDTLVARACSATQLHLPPTAGTPSSALVAVDLGSGRLVSALAIVEPGVTATMLGWLDGETALAQVTGEGRTLLLGWNVRQRRFGVVSTLDALATLSVADQTTWR
jgi:hypothetical protein